jgi:acyl-coenzyme A synthetase/AMP-(fatty) acid ligase
VIDEFDGLLVRYVDDFPGEAEASSAQAPGFVGGKDIVFFTSGTTGKPKGVVLPQSVFDFSNATAAPDVEPVRHFLCRPLFFRAHLAVACHILAEGNTLLLSRFGGIDALQMLAVRHYPSFVSLGPSDLMAWLDGEVTFPASVKHVMTTGSRLTNTLRQRIAARMPGIRVTDVYGTSEVGAIAMIDSEEWADREGSCGKPTFFAHVVILDEAGVQLDSGGIGEVCVKSRYRLRNYVGDEMATKAAFAGEYVRTGDMGYLDEQGYLYLTGRKDDTINRGGYHVFPDEVESVLREVTGVEEAVVIGLEHPQRLLEPVAYIRLREADRIGTAVETEKAKALIAHCSERLPRYKVPDEIRFVREIPVNAAGKADRRLLVSRAGKLRESIYR